MTESRALTPELCVITVLKANLEKPLRRTVVDRWAKGKRSSAHLHTSQKFGQVRCNVGRDGAVEDGEKGLVDEGEGV